MCEESCVLIAAVFEAMHKMLKLMKHMASET